MRVSRRAIESPLEERRARYERDVELLLQAAVRVLERRGLGSATVADILAEAGLGTRAFYRHFRSKDELFLAVYERDSEQSRRRMEQRLAARSRPAERLVAWVEEVLALGFDRRRARRTQVFASEAAALRVRHPEVLIAIEDGAVQPLVSILEAGRRVGEFPEARPEDDARSIYAVTWTLVEDRLAGRGPATAAAARDYVLRFCLPALGARPDEPVAAPCDDPFPSLEEDR